MAAATTVVEGKIKFREGKKWKPRWCVLKKPSPVADQLQVVLFKDVNEVVKDDPKPKSVFALDSFFGLDSGFPFDRETNVLAIICQKQIHLMAFDVSEKMIEFEIRIRQSLGEENQFPVTVVKAPSNSRLPKEQVRMMIHDLRFCLIAQAPPKILLSWNIEDLRRFGATDGKFCFEGGTRCGKGTGVFALHSEQAEDIADIVKLASTGKMSNCHRKFKNRSSQIDFSNHLITNMSPSPSSLSIHHPHQNIVVRTPPAGVLPVTLNCCHDNQTGSSESEDWSWYKRHSVSVMDHHRIAVLRDKGYLDNRDQFIGIYDVPPNHGRMLEHYFQDSSEEPNYAVPRNDPDPGTWSSCKNSNNENGNYKKIVPRKKENEYGNKEEHRQILFQKRQSASAEFFDLKVSSVEEMVAKSWQHNDSSPHDSHEESLQRLKMQESDLQREMVLLDEILQNCAAKSQEFNSGEQRKEPENTVTLKSGSETKNINRSFLTGLDQNLTIISGNISPLKLKLDQASTPKKMDRATALRLNTSMPEGTPISPIFQAKLNNLPPNSRLNAPLPYVNLSKYDDESNSHVHLPGSADCIPVACGQSLLGLNEKNVRLRVHSSLTSLNCPAPASSLINLNHSFADHQYSSGQRMAERALPRLPQDSGSMLCMQGNSKQNEHQEILIVNMDESHTSEPIIYASLQCMVPDGPSKTSSDLISILTSDSSRPFREEKRINQEDLYENLPVRRDDIAPPELPPKGPALLKKLKAAASKNSTTAFKHSTSSHQDLSQSPPFVCPRHHSEKNTQDFSVKNHFGYNNHPRQNCSDLEKERKPDTKEDNYCMMGSPKVQHKLSTVTQSPFKSSTNRSTNTHGPKAQHATSLNLPTRNDYMDMGIIGSEGGEDDIYLDVDAVQNHLNRDLYISEADLKLPSSSNDPKVSGESTYMEMASVSNRKSVVVQNLETLQTYVCKTPGWDVTKASPRPRDAPPPPPPHPPHPTSLKIRHNSDSRALPTKANEPTSENGMEQNKPKPMKSPTKVYTKAKKTKDPNQGASTPFPNLIEFTKKMSESRSTYVNTLIESEKSSVAQEAYLTSRDVPLPEPSKEGFLARFKRRSSKDKNAPLPQDKSSKNRNSVLERSMSEHESSKAAKDEKTSKLKLGRRRSSSFPNRLSYQESLDGNGVPVTSQAGSSSSSFSSGSSRPKQTMKRTDQSESSSSIQDFSDDSDMSPLLKRGEKRFDSRAITVLHVHHDNPNPVNPYMQICKTPSKAADSSKTDDEKLIEMIQLKHSQKKPVVYQRSSSLDLKKNNKDCEQGFYLKLPKPSHRTERRFSFEKLVCSNSAESTSSKCQVSPYNEGTNSSRHSSLPSSSYSLDNLEEHPPPSLPPKTKSYQGPLSPVIETAPPLPSFSEPLYVDLDEIEAVPSSERTSNQRMENADGAKSDQEIDGELILFPKKAGAGKKLSSLPVQQGNMIGRLSSDVENENMDQLNYTTVTLPIEVTPSQGNMANTERYTTRPLSWSQGLATSQHVSDSSGHCSSPAKTVLRPRSGQEYVLIQRILRLPHTGQEMPSPPSKVFTFDPHFETLSHFSSLQSSPQHSPNFSSMADTTRSCNSFHCDAWDRDHSSRNSLQRHPHPLKHITTAVSSPCSSPHTVMPQLQPYLTDEQLSSHSNTIEESIFFPRDRSDTSSQPPSPYHQPSPSIHLHYPIYVNQEYIPKQHSTSPSNRSSSTSSSHSSASPIKAGVHSLMTLFFSPKHTSSSDSHASRPTNRVSCNTRHSESDATKLEKHSFSLPPRRSSQVLSLPVNVQRSHSDPKRLEKGEKPVLSLPPKQPITGHVPKEPIVGHSSKVHKQEFDKFANSSIISRRRLQCTEVKVEGQSMDSVVNSCRLPETEPSDSIGHMLQIPQLKSSGYKNIDTFNAAAAVASSSAHATTVSYTPLTGHLSLLPNISELLIPSNEVHSTDENLHSPGTKSSLNSLSYGSNRYPPPPLIPRRHTSSSSPLSSRSSSSSDISDSPPSYYAPSPPAMLPALPPREPLIPPIPLPSPAVTSSPSETDEVLALSDEEQELNYIEVDMTKTRSAATPPRPPAYVRRSKRVQQKKEKDYAKLRYVLIDHSATKALMEARQEHVQARDGTQAKSSTQLNRINSAPASSKRKHFTFTTKEPRERKLSSGSVESC